MTDLFLKVVNVGIAAGWLVLAVILVRLVLKKAPKWFNPVLWGIVGLRLIFPFSIESVFSLIPSAETISPEILLAPEPEIHSGVPILNSAVNPVIQEVFAPEAAASVNPLQIWIPVAAAVWAVGVAAMLLYALISYRRLHRRVRTAVLLRDNIYQSENVSSPFVLGLLRPRIYLPFHMAEPDMPHVIAHEQAHIRRRDHWLKPIGFGLLSLYWFHPALWAAYILLCRDIELACDERVIRGLDAKQRADYSQALLSCSTPGKRITACPIAFGEVGVKQRVKNVLNYKKPGFWLIAAAVIAAVLLAVCFLTNPAATPDDAGEAAGAISSAAGADPAGISSEIVYSWVSYSQDGCAAMADRAVNRDSERQYGNVAHWIPLVKLDTKADYDAFYTEMSAYLDFTANREGTTAFGEQAKRYTEDFFEDHTLLIAYITETASSNRHKVEEVRADNGTLEVRICQIVPEDQAGDTAMAGWFLAVAVPTAEIAHCLRYDAYICATEYPDRLVPSGNLTGIYRFQWEDVTHRASVSLYDSGEFCFSFSPLSSYVGYGTYTAEGDCLTLNTSDGKFTYVFHVVDDTLVFDAGASSGQTWFSGIYDGAVFK